MNEREPRRDSILSAAISVFSRFGYRRASMDDVARAAQLSRQGLYLYFPTKEALFRAAVARLLEASSAACAAALEGEGSIDERVVAAFDAMYGPHLGGLSVSPHLAEFLDTARELLGDAFVESERTVRDMIARALIDGGVVERAKDSGLSAQELTLSLEAFADGSKRFAKDREDFVARMWVGVRAICRTPIRVLDDGG
jgi:AcrR family transcriptional regulator